jgi:hypothetical protein
VSLQTVLKQMFDNKQSICYTNDIAGNTWPRLFMSSIRNSLRTTVPDKQRLQHWGQQLRLALVGVGRLCLPSARGVYHPQLHSRVILGVALPPHANLDDVERRLWWRGLGLVERSGQLIAGADVTTAVQLRRMRHARALVTKQLRDAGIRGAVKRWE